MISIKEDYVIVEGDKPTIMAELGGIINCLIYENDFSFEDIDKIVELGKKTIEEVHEENKRMAQNILAMAMLGAMFNGMKGEDDD